jgi:putative spermidine/putrescine transport system substrate-binding protein
VSEAQGQEVSLWMWGGDERGNAYVDEVLAPAVAARGVTLRRVPIADTADALNRVLAELQAGERNGSVDLVWVNGENFRTGVRAGAWTCGWADLLPNAQYLDPADPLLLCDFGTPVDGCEAPWHKAQFVLAYDSADVAEVPTTLPELFAWAQANPGRFTYPAPPDFTGSAFVRQALYAVAGGPENVPATYDPALAEDLTEQLWGELSALAPSLWRGGDTYPRDVTQLEELFAGDQVSFTMTYGPATLDALVADGTLPATTKVLPLDDGTLGNASFLAIPANAGSAAGAMVVADVALSPEQQLAKADPAVWGQFTVLDLERLPAGVAAGFADLPASAVVPPFSELSDGADPELAADWVAPLEQGWRSSVLTRP